MAHGQMDHPVNRASICLLVWRGEKEALPESGEDFEVAAAQTSGPVNLVLSCETVFSSARIHELLINQ